MEWEGPVSLTSPTSSHFPTPPGGFTTWPDRKPGNWALKQSLTSFQRGGETGERERKKWALGEGIFKVGGDLCGLTQEGKMAKDIDLCRESELACLAHAWFPWLPGHPPWH